MRKALQAMNGEIVAIAAEKIPVLQDGLTRHPGLPCIVAGDPNAEAAASLNLIQGKLAMVGKKLAIPSNILVDKKGVVRWVHVAQLVMDRPDPKFVLSKVRELNSLKIATTTHSSRRWG